MLVQRLAKLLIQNHEQVEDPLVRKNYGSLMSGLGIASNILLAAIKFVAGSIAGSIAITSDAWNNATDMVASLISLLSFKLSAKPPDKKHPFGHARFEYLASSVVALIILLVAWELLKTSVDRIIKPRPITMDWLVAVILVFSVFLKLWQWNSYRRTGEMIDSQVFRATATDSLADAVTTSSVLLTTLIAHFTGLRLDGWIGLLVSLFIFYSGFIILRDTATSLLGAAPPQELVLELEDMILSYPDVLGMHDLLVHDYGPGKTFASVHVEVDATMPSLASHELIDRIERDILYQQGIHLIIHIDPIIIDDPELAAYKEKISSLIHTMSDRFKLHDVRLMRSKERASLFFDLVIPDDYPLEDDEIKQVLLRRIFDAEPDLNPLITIERGSSYQ